MSRFVIVLGSDGPHPLVITGGSDGPQPLMYDGGDGGPKPLVYSKRDPLQSRLTVTLYGDKSVSHQAPKLPVALTFYHKFDVVQRFTSDEYAFSLLDSDGVQVESGLSQAPVFREVALSGRSTVDRPDVFLNEDAVKAGQRYLFVCHIRNLTGAVNFEVA